MPSVTLSAMMGLWELAFKTAGRPTKRPIGRGDFSLGGQTFTRTAGRIPRADKRGYPQPPEGVTFPVEVSVTAVA